MKLFALAFLLISVLSSCTNRGYRDFHVRFENNYHQEIRKIEITSKRGIYARRDFLSPGGESVAGLGFTYPANDVYEIRWEYSDKEVYQKRIDLRKDLPEDFIGHIVFSVSEKNELVFYQWLSPFQYDYSIDIRNTSGSIIYKPSIKSSRGVLHITEYLRDKLLNGDEIKFRHMRKFPANSVYTITWLSENGVEYGKEIDLTQTIDEDFDGAVQFTINEEHQVGYSCK